jgi:hypothetical protein
VANEFDFPIAARAPPARKQIPLLIWIGGAIGVSAALASSISPRKEQLMRPLLASLCFFAIATTGAFAGQYWWEIYTPAEQDKLFKDYEKYVYNEAGPLTGEVCRGVDYPNYAKALHMYTNKKGFHHILGKGVKFHREKHEATTKAKQIHQAKFHAQAAKEMLWRVEQVDERFWKWKLKETLPDEVLDDYIWWFQANSIGGQNNSHPLGALRRFGKRAERFYEPVRQWGIKNDRIADALALMNAIKPKKE